MPFIAIMGVTEDNRVAKYQPFETQAEADAHVAEFGDRYPAAFVVADPPDTIDNLRVDVQARRVTADPVPPPPPPPENPVVTALRRLASATGTDISDLDI